tara:strand:- start:13505 stop:13867 length:363 start_codon:yes stop_codon:yes gene_type:complete
MSDSIEFDNSENKFKPFDFDTDSSWNTFYNDSLRSSNNPDILHFPNRARDMVNSPSHYTSGRVEAIEVIEDATKDAPTVMAGVYQANVLKYLLRLWHKSNSKEDAQKAEWYLKKLIDSLE